MANPNPNLHNKTSFLVMKIMLVMPTRSLLSGTRCFFGSCANSIGSRDSMAP
jgi:hypothetical protein